jgi:hypothetical protein
MPAGLDARRHLGRGLLLDLARRPRQGLNALLLRPEFTTGRLDVSFIAMSARRIFEVEDHAYQHAARRRLQAAARTGMPTEPTP